MKAFRVVSAVVLAVIASGLSQASAEEVRIDSRDCRQIAKYRPAADVAYRSGVDVRGKKVAPADLGGAGRLSLPDVYSFPVNIDIGRYLGRPEEQAAAASAAALAADRAKAAATSAALAAADAVSAAEAARDVADAKAADATAAQTAADAAQAAYDANPSDRALRDAARAAKTTATEAATEAAQADATAGAIESQAQVVEDNADTADAATSVAGKAMAAATAATQAETTATLAAEMAGDPVVGEDATITALRTAAQTASSSATSTETAAAASAASNSDLEAAYRKASKYGNLDMKAGTVRYDINTGELTFNGQPLSDADSRAIAEACARLQAGKKP